MTRSAPLMLVCIILAPLSNNGFAQTYPTDDPVIREIWDLGMENSMTRELAHELMDVVGPRLYGSPGLTAAEDWVLGKYDAWGIEAEREEYGTWTGWESGILHVDMVEPRVTTLETELLAWSLGTDGLVEGDVALPPADLSSENVDEWLSTVRGKFVLMSAPELMCRADQELEANARPETV